MDLQDLLDCTINVILTGRFTVIDLDREGSTRDCVGGGISKELGEFLGVHSSRSDNELQITSTRQDLSK